MSDKNFSRTRIGESERKFGEAPILGRVSRTPGSVVQGRGKRRRQMRRNKTKVNFVVVAWTLLVSFVVLMVLVIFLVGYFRKQANESIVDSSFGEFADSSATAASTQKTVELPVIDEIEALGIVREAFANGDAQDIARHFNLGDGTSPEEALAALSGVTAREGEITSYQWMGQRYLNSMAIGEVATQRESAGENSNRLAQLVIGDDGKWRIDLDSYLRKSIPEWPEILAGKSPTSVIRIFVAEDTYYNGIYSEDSEWQAYLLVSPGTQNTLYGYAKRGSTQEKALRRILRSEEKINRATVQISTHPEAGERQFEITGVLAESWVIGDKRFDESF